LRPWILNLLPLNGYKKGKEEEQGAGWLASQSNRKIGEKWANQRSKGALEKMRNTKGIMDRSLRVRRRKKLT
jgi:hypothetical protein